MEFLDKTGVATLWNKIKDYIGTETKKYLPLSGGTMTGGIECRTPNNSLLYSIETAGDVSNNHGSGYIQCKNVVTNHSVTIQGGRIDIYGGNGTDTIPDKIGFSDRNIYIYFRQNGISHEYKFNLQKLIDDGYLIEE